MKVILNEDVAKLGKKGEVVEVSEGYGRNFLLPRKLAEPATKANLNAAGEKAASAARKKQQDADEARLLAAQLEKLALTIPVNVGDNGKLFGKVTGQTIAEALEKENVTVDKKKIAIKGEVTGEGEYEAVIKVHPQVTSVIKFTVVKK